MNLKRSNDAEFLNRVVNDPSVHPFVSFGRGPIDLTAVVNNHDNVFLANEHGGFLYVSHGDTFEVHTQFLPEGRGDTATLARESLFYMFTQTPCVRIDTLIPPFNKTAKRLAEAVGMKSVAQAEVFGFPVTVYMLTIKEWARSLACPSQPLEQ